MISGAIEEGLQERKKAKDEQKLAEAEAAKKAVDEPVAVKNAPEAPAAEAEKVASSDDK